MYKELFNIKSNDNKFWELLKSRLGLDRKNLLEQHSEADIDKGWAWDGSRIEDENLGIVLDFDVRDEEGVGRGKKPKYYYLSVIYFRINPDRDYYSGKKFEGTLPLDLSLDDNTPDKIKAKLGTPTRELYFSDGKTTRVCAYNNDFSYRFHFYENTGLLKTLEIHYNG